MRSASAKLRARRAARRAAISCSISVDRHGRLLVLAPPERQNAEHLVEAIERLRERGGVGRAQARRRRWPSSARGRGRTSRQCRPRCSRRARCGAENAVPRFLEPASRSVGFGSRAGSESSRARKSVSRLSDFFGLRHRGPRELQLLAVVHAEVQVAQRRRPEARARRCRAGCRRCRATSTSSPAPLVSSSLVSIIRCSTCTQKRENCCPVAPSLCAISFS